MAKYEDYVREVQGNTPEGIDSEISDSAGQQAARLDDATQQVDWEKRYSELEKLNSRQAQTLGDYRKTIDTFITDPTPEESQTPDIEPSAITVDDLYDDPNAAVHKAVESHPAIREAREMKQVMVERERQVELEGFTDRHADYQDITATPEFQNWVDENPTRRTLYLRGNSYDFSAADALFSLYKAEQGLSQATSAQELAQVELVSGTGELTQEPSTYSRSEYINKLMRSKQGDREAEMWVTAHSANYRIALGNGNVRD
jgi:hypothetical protein